MVLVCVKNFKQYVMFFARWQNYMNLFIIFICIMHICWKYPGLVYIDFTNGFYLSLMVLWNQAPNGWLIQKCSSGVMFCKEEVWLVIVIKIRLGYWWGLGANNDWLYGLRLWGDSVESGEVSRWFNILIFKLIQPRDIFWVTCWGY